MHWKLISNDDDSNSKPKSIAQSLNFGIYVCIFLLFVFVQVALSFPEMQINYFAIKEQLCHNQICLFFERQNRLANSQMIIQLEPFASQLMMCTLTPLASFVQSSLPVSICLAVIIGMALQTYIFCLYGYLVHLSSPVI